MIDLFSGRFDDFTLSIYKSQFQQASACRGRRIHNTESRGLAHSDPDHPERLVGYGQTGRVRLTTLTREFFMPRFLERDEAEREAPCDLYPWDGVRNVRPFSRFQSKVVEGVY